MELLDFLPIFIKSTNNGNDFSGYFHNFGQKGESPNVGLEPTTLRLRVSCSTDWASRAHSFLEVGSFPCLLLHKINQLSRQNYHLQWHAVVAEWLRRLTRNQIPSGSVGSNPTDCEKNFYKFYKIVLFLSE